MTTIKDIAKLAGVSITTVSRVLNNHPYVNIDKRNKVQEIINELNYQQNSNAIHLVKGKTLTIGVICPYFDGTYFQTLIKGITDEAFKNNYSVMLCPTNYDKKQELKYLNMLKTKQLDGVIICSRANHWEEIYPFLEFGTIVICEYAEGFPCVYTNHYDAFSNAIKYLIEEGHLNIGYCIGRKNSLNSRTRASAYRAELKRIQQPIQESWIFTDCYSIDDGKDVLKKFLSLKKRPTAILVNGDSIAAGIIIQAKKEGIRIPEDLAIIGFDNQVMAEVLDLTTIDQNLVEIGLQAFTLFINNENKKIEIPFSIIKRKTV